MESETVATVETVTETLPVPSGGVSQPPALMFIGYGVAMIAAGQWMLEHGIKRAGGWKGIRRILTRAESAVTALEAAETVAIATGASVDEPSLS